ncbi:MAG: 2-C-methyl-D-erythritol 2,4-cyclodiphosphate synthase [Kangiellaceae bacterium]|nr:2-C-methyl-D-erythritol 2,4-cyclodiphosphate synthase [Kangiellaceae bacterium]
MIRIGHGFDVHSFGGDKTLKLGGVEFLDHIGLVAHSDGDVLLHAVCDALLGAAALGDIGRHFPDDDLKYSNIDSMQLLSHVFQLVCKSGYIINNLDVTVIAQTPRLKDYISDIENAIASQLTILPNQINVKATTTERLGYVGRKEGIAVHCVCLIQSNTEC